MILLNPTRVLGIAGLTFHFTDHHISPAQIHSEGSQTRRLPSSLGSLLVAGWAKVTHKSRYKWPTCRKCSHRDFLPRFFTVARVLPSRPAFLTPELLTAVHTSWSEVSLWLVPVMRAGLWGLPREVACVLYGPFHPTNEVVDKELSPEGPGNTQRQNQGYYETDNSLLLPVFKQF